MRRILASHPPFCQCRTYPPAHESENEKEKENEKERALEASMFYAELWNAHVLYVSGEGSSARVRLELRVRFGLPLRLVVGRRSSGIGQMYSVYSTCT